MDLVNEQLIEKVRLLIGNFQGQFIRYYLILEENVTDLIDLSSPDTHRTDVSQSEIGNKQRKKNFSFVKRKIIFVLETHRQQLSQIPSLQQLLSTAAGSSNEQQQYRDNQLLSKDYDDPLTQHLLRYSELISNDLEEKPITEKMDHWYLDLKKNLMVTKKSVSFFDLLLMSFSSFRLD